MPKHFRASRALIRCLAPALLLAVVFLAAPAAYGQHTTGFNLIKDCPQTAPANTNVICTFTVTNQDPLHGVINFGVTNEFPFPAGSPVAVDCNQAGSPVTSLGVNGTPTDTCTGTLTEPSGPCSGTDTVRADEIAVTGTDPGTQLPVSSSTSNAFIVPACTPTPTNTPPNTPTNTPPPSAPPPVPTLSFPMMALLGLLLAGAGLFFARRQ